VRLLGVVTEPAHVLDYLAVVIDPHVVQLADAAGTAERGRLALQSIQPMEVERLSVPVHLRQPAVQTRLIGRQARDPTHADNNAIAPG